MTDEADYQPPPPDPALRRLDFLVGKWDLTGSTVDGPMGPAGEVAGVETFDWMEGGYFLIHRWDGTFEVAGTKVIDTGYEFYDYDAETGRYRAHFFNNLGPYDQEGSRYVGDFDGDALVITGPARVVRRPNPDGTISVDADISPDGQTWTPMMRTKLTKTG